MAQFGVACEATKISLAADIDDLPPGTNWEYVRLLMTGLKILQHPSMQYSVTKINDSPDMAFTEDLL